MSIIEVENLHKRYGETIAVDDVSFTVERGEIFGILGRNGAGKTTTVECVGGLRVADSGTIRVLGLDPQANRKALTKRLGIQLQESELQEKIKVSEAIDLYSSFYDDPANGDELLEMLGIADKRGTQFRHLSGGQKQRLSIALALIGNPEIAILDELTTGLDPQARRDTWELIKGVRGRGVTIVLVTHFMDEAERLCDRLALIDAGRVAALDTPDGLIREVNGEQRVRFRPSGEFADDIITEIPGVARMDRDDTGVVTVTGNGDIVGPVVQALTQHQVVPAELKVEQANLEDAFVALTGRAFDADAEPATK